MGAEETELTFVRCPSCRSLIPAVATRCRMCGFVLKENGTSESAAEPASPPPLDSKKSRVRQRSVSLSKAELSELKSDLGLESTGEGASVEPPAPEPAPAEPAEPAVEAPKLDRSLDYVLGSEEEAEQSSSRSIIDRIIENTEDSEPEEPEVFAQPQVEEQAAPPSESIILGAPPEEASVVETDEDATEGKRKRKRRRSRKRKRRGDEPLEGASEESEAELIEEEEAPSSVEVSQPEVEQVSVNNHSEDKVMEQAVREERRPRKELPVKANPKKDLIGWFVNFESGFGDATEIRAGRFFVGSERVKSTDLVIDHDTISAPHCLISASREGGMRVQDLMSEQGTYVKKSGKKNYVQPTEAVELEHGDYVKLGEYEVMVCIIPAAGKLTGNGAAEEN